MGLEKNAFFEIKQLWIPEFITRLLLYMYFHKYISVKCYETTIDIKSVLSVTPDGITFYRNENSTVRIISVYIIQTIPQYFEN